jgi:hypothetical protein
MGDRRREVVEAVRREIHGIGVEIACDRESLAALADRRLSAFPRSTAKPAVSIDLRLEAPQRSGPRPPDLRIVHQTPSGSVAYSDSLDELWVDYGHSAAHCFLGEGRATIEVDPRSEGWEWVATRPLLTLSLLELLKRHSLFGIHAAGAACDGRAVLFAGTSGSGKSTVALALLLAGWSFLGDDVAFLRSTDGEIELLAFPDEIDASPATIRLFPELGAPEQWPSLAGYAKRQLLPDRVRPGAISASAVPALLVLPRIDGRQEQHRFERAEPEDVLVELVPNVLLTDRATSQTHLDLLSAIARRVPAYRLTLGSRPEELPSLLAEVLRPS